MWGILSVASELLCDLLCNTICGLHYPRFMRSASSAVIIPNLTAPKRGARKTPKMSKSTSTAAADRLREFARGSGSPCSPGTGSKMKDPISERATGAEADTESEPTLRQVTTQLLEAIQSSTTSLTGKIEEVKIDVGLLRQDLQNLRGRVREVEDRVSTLEDTTAPIPAKVEVLEKAANSWVQRADDLENRLRRNNLRILGLPERSEGQHPCEFVERWLKELLPEAQFTPLFAVERAHRVPARALPPGAPPRPFLARMLSSKDRDAALQAARKIPELKYNGASISIFPDFSAALQKIRATFIDVKRRLRSHSIPYSMAYPARLRVAHNDKTLFFTSPKEAEEWLNLLPGPQRAR